MVAVMVLPSLLITVQTHIRNIFYTNICQGMGMVLPQTIRTLMTTNLTKAASLKEEVVSSAEKLPVERSRVTWIDQVSTFNTTGQKTTNYKCCPIPLFGPNSIWSGFTQNGEILRLKFYNSQDFCTSSTSSCCAARRRGELGIFANSFQFPKSIQVPVLVPDRERELSSSCGNPNICPQLSLDSADSCCCVNYI